MPPRTTKTHLPNSAPVRAAGAPKTRSGVRRAAAAGSAPRRDPRRLAILAHDNLCTFEFGVAIELFGLDREELSPWYRHQVCALEKGPVQARGGVTVDVPFGLGALDRAGTIVIPGWTGVDAPVPPALNRKLQRAHAAGARLLSICSGAFVLAAAGLLDGRRATTHWMYAQQLQDRFPAVEVDPNVLFVDEGQVITSAGSAAGIDAGLHLIRRDAGAAVANTIARRLVVPPQREGGQQQFIARAVPEVAEESGLSELLDRLQQRLHEEHTVESLSAELSMSPRTFARRFGERTGTTPHRWLTAQRVDRARELLETSDRSLDEIAACCGFSEAQLLRLHFKARVGTTPSAYRKSFR